MTNKAVSQDVLQRFLFENTSVRGEIVRLHASWKAVLEKYDYPPVVRELLGEAMAAMALLGATIKYQGSLTLQIQGQGPVSLLVVQVTSERTLRGMAHCDAEVRAGTLRDLVGETHLVISIEQGATGERYQGIVDIGNGSLSEALENYFHRSEQLETRLWLEADSEYAAGLLIQQMPGHELDEDDTWDRIYTLADTITRDELLQLPFMEIIHRLYHEEDVRLFESEPLSFRCQCSRQRIEETLRSLGYDEMQDILREEGHVGVSCEFCNQFYDFDSVDIEAAFASSERLVAPKTRQ